MHESVALYEDPDRVVLRVAGDRAEKVLDGLLSADISSLEPDRSVLSFVLTSKGRPVAVPHVVRAAGSFFLDVSILALEPLMRHLSVYIPPRFARITLLEGVRRVSLIGPAWRGAVQRATDELGLAPGWDEASHEPGRVLPSSATGGSPNRPLFAVVRAAAEGGGLDVSIPGSAPALEALSEAVVLQGGFIAHAVDYDVWRMETGIPLFGRDVSEENLPQETGLVERAVSFGKGCYTGQEVVARIRYRGHVNRFLRGLRSIAAASGEPLPPGSEVYAGGRSVGQVTSSGVSPRLGPIALAYIRREHGPGGRVGARPQGDPAWSICELPFTMT